LAERSRGGRRNRTPAPAEKALRRTGRHTGRHKPSPGTARQGTLNPTGPLVSVAPAAASGRSFGHGVVTEQKKGSSAWVWLLAVAGIGGLAYFAYTLFTSK
ncbi:MAG: hypothetical protein KDK70_22795, partial [Myxococcales bacterium]|nr:hypothetical protein [Myxococcales bacterium]